MYIRPVHAELDIPTLYAFIKQYPLGLFTTSIQHPQIPIIQTTHIPFVLDEPPAMTEDSTTSAANNSPPPLGVLRGHMARANPQTKAMIDHFQSPPPASTTSYLSSFLPSSLSTSIIPSTDDITLKDEVLVLFQAPTHSYLTPKFYTETKPSTGKVVPTWDYCAVQVYGTARIHYKSNAETGEFLQKQVEDLTDQRESAMGHDKPWKVGDSPVSYVEALKKGIIGLEIQIKRIEGRFKLSQESTDGDWVGVVEGFRNLGTEEGRKMAELVEERGKSRKVNIEKRDKEEENAVPPVA